MQAQRPRTAFIDTATGLQESAASWECTSSSSTTRPATKTTPFSSSSSSNFSSSTTSSTFLPASTYRSKRFAAPATRLRRASTAFWPIRCDGPDGYQSDAKFVQKVAALDWKETAGGVCPPSKNAGSSGDEPDNPTKYDVEKFAHEQRDLAEDELTGRREKSRHFENSFGDARVEKITRAAEAAEASAAARSKAEQVVRKSEYTVEKLIHGVPPWAKSPAGQLAEEAARAGARKPKGTPSWCKARDHSKG
ncbi:unnamed protein product, partial [Amoebophrya sp. A25]|eukprot:GSA25T00012374001.1